MLSQRRIRIVMAKLGVDGHDIGIKFISTGLRDAGMEVIYLGPYQTPDSVVKAAIDEDVDIIGLSALGGGHLNQAQRLFNTLKEKGIQIPIIMGGVIPRQDIPELEEVGVKKVFLTGATISSIADSIRETLKEKTSD
ncbi:MAG: cobalamin-dependent protein [Chloroflexota bacterium]|nr:cobalamin-dependent protein [Chloroflexota bacterium]